MVIQLLFKLKLPECFVGVPLYEIVNKLLLCIYIYIITTEQYPEEIAADNEVESSFLSKLSTSNNGSTTATTTAAASNAVEVTPDSTNNNPANNGQSPPAISPKSRSPDSTPYNNQDSKFADDGKYDLSCTCTIILLFSIILTII